MRTIDGFEFVIVEIHCRFANHFVVPAAFSPRESGEGP